MGFGVRQYYAVSSSSCLSLASAWVLCIGLQSSKKKWLKHGLSVGCNFSQGISTCPSVWSSRACRVGICSNVELSTFFRDSLIHHGLHQGLQGNLSSGSWSTSSPSVFPGLGFCRVVALTIFFPTPVSHSFCLPFLKYVITKASPASLMNSSLASSESILELSGAVSLHHGDNPWSFLTEATPEATLPTPCHKN